MRDEDLICVIENIESSSPPEKRTITGLARTGWRKATRDWIKYVKSINAAGNKVVSIGSRRPTMSTAK